MIFTLITDLNIPFYHFIISPKCLHLVVVWGLASLNDLTGYASLVVASQAGQAVREKPD